MYIHSIQQDSCIYIKIRIYTLDSCSSDIKESMTAGSIIVLSNGDRKMAANEEAISALLRCVYRAMTEEITPASNVEEELSRVFFFPVLVQPPLCNSRVNYESNASSGKKGRLRSTSWKVKSAKESPPSISCKELEAILE